MPKKVRRRILYILVIVFLILGSGVVFYAQGLRVSFHPFKVGKVGGIYIRTFPTYAEVRLDQKLRERKIGLFDKGTLFNDVLPGEYEIEVSAKDYESWKILVQVNSSLVTSIQNVVLVPKTSSLTASSTPVQDISSVGASILLRNASGTKTLSGIPIGSGQVLAGSEDGNIILSYATTSKNYFFTDIPRATSTNLGRLAEQGGSRSAISFQPVPRDNTLFLTKSSTGLSLLRISSGETLQLTTSTVIASAAAGGKVVWADFNSKTNSSALSTYEISSRSYKESFEFIPGKIKSLLLLDSGEILTLADDGSLYSLNFNQSSRVRLSNDARDIALSRNSDGVAILEDQRIIINFARSNKPSLEIDMPDAAQIRRLTWYRDGGHLFVHYPDRIMFLDLRDSSLANFRLVTKAEDAEYDPNENVLYALQEGLLYAFRFPSS